MNWPARRFVLEAPEVAQWLMLLVASLGLVAGIVLSPALSFITIAGVGGVYAAYRWPLVFVVLTIWTYVAPTFYIADVGSFGLAPYVLFEVLSLVGVTLRCLVTRTRIVLPPGFTCLVAFALLTSVSAFLASDVWAAGSLLARAWLTWLVVMLAMTVVPDRRRLRILLAALLFQALVVVGVSVASSLSNLGLPSFPSLLFMHFQKNDYATYLSFAVALAVVGITAKWGRAGGRVVSVAVLILAFVSWPLTYSRSGLMALASMLVAFVFLHRTARLIRSFAIVAVLAAGAWFVLPTEVQAISTRAIQSLLGSGNQDRDSFVDTYEDRLVLNWAAVESIRKNPLFGVGLGQWSERSPVQVPVWDLKRGQSTIVGAAVHNRLLFIAAESGVLALAGYVGFLGMLLWSAFKARARADPWMKLLLNALIACTLGYLVSMLFIPGSLWEWNLLALLAATVHVAWQEADASPG